MTRPVPRPCRRLPVPLVLLLLLALSQPAAAAIYAVPKKIRDNCSAAVEKQVMDWLATVPDGNTAQFGKGRCYGQDATIAVARRRNLTIDGQGSEFRAITKGASHRTNWRFVEGANLTVRNLAVRGSNPQGSYDPAIEWQHGFSIEGVQGMALSGVTARETWGDGVMVWRGASSPACGDDASSARNVTISYSLLERNGRQGLAIVDGEYVTLRDSTVGPVAWSNVDIETDDDCEIARHITILRNRFGANRYGVIANVGFGAEPQVGDVTVEGNEQTAATGAAGECWAPVRILSPDAAYRRRYSFRGNRFLARRNGLELRRVRDVDVGQNNVTLTPTTGCGKRAGVLLVDSHSVAITGNVFSGANYVYTADPLSSGVTADGNSTG